MARFTASNTGIHHGADVSHAVAPGKSASDLTLIAAGFSPKGESETELERVPGSCHKSATTMRLCSIC